MCRFRSQRMNSESGFSLVELLAVTAVLMFLSLFTIPIYHELTDKARLATSLEDLRVIEEALEAFQADYGHYPSRLGLLTKEGYLRPDFNFQSPWSNDNKNRYYFYAVDNSKWPSAFILGDPGPQPECNQSSPVTLYRSSRELLPCGTNPKDRARVFAGSEPEVLLDDHQLSTLSGYRERCDPRLERNLKLAPGCIVKTES